jgi:hypothetical protein
MPPEREGGVKVSECLALVMASSVFIAADMSAQSANASEIHKMPFEYTNSQVWVKGQIAGETGRFLVDTGSVSTIVDARFAKTTGLKADGGEVTVPFAFYPRTVGRKVWLENLRIGSLSIHNQSAVVADLSPVSKHAGATIDAIIGMDTFCRLATLEIDYKRRELAMMTADRGQQGNCPSISPIVQITVSGQPSRLLVDTGSRFGITLFGATEALVMSRVTLAEFGAAEFDAQVIRRPAGASEIDGLIGSGILEFLRVQFGERRTQILLRESLN